MKFAKVSKMLYKPVKYYSSAVPKPDLNPKLPNLKLFINNEWVDSLESGNFFTAINPTNEKAIAQVQSASKSDLDRAVEAAKKAFQRDSPWRKMDGSQRGKLLLKLAKLLERDRVLISSLETLEVGKLFSIADKIHMKTNLSMVLEGANMADVLNGSQLPVSGEYIHYKEKEPIGVCGLISAWNFQTCMMIIKLVHCLATGNVAIIKPSQFGCLASLHIAELIKEAGFPAGVVSVLPGTKVLGREMADHPDIDLISMTSSSEAGQDVYRRGAKNLKKLIMELGGKSAIVVCDDADLDKAVQLAQYAIFFNSGQNCCAASRAYVHESIYEKFLERSKMFARKLKIGDPFDPRVMHGPLANAPHFEQVMNMVDIGKKEGCTLEQGGIRCEREGLFMEPAIFSNVPDNLTLSKEEIFGPVQLISPFKTLDEAIDKVNSSKYGLSSGIISNNLDNTTTFTQRVRTGTIWVNCYYIMNNMTPFGGYKMSGLGREGAAGGYYAFTKEKNINIKSHY